MLWPARASGFFGFKSTRRYFSEGEKRRPEIRLRFAGYTCLGHYNGQSTQKRVFFFLTSPWNCIIEGLSKY